VGLPGLLAKEQRAFLRRSRRDWGAHLERARTFFGKALQAADPQRSVLILGAGSGLEIPWRLAGSHTAGWDADPWSRCRTFLRHGRFPEWIFEDFTGGLKALENTARRARTLPLERGSRTTERALLRFQGLLPSLHPDPQRLERWLEVNRPGTVLLANVLGQLGHVAQSTVETSLGLSDSEDPDLLEPLWNALDDWVRRALEAVLGVLLVSGAELWMIHDRAVIWGEQSIQLGPLQDPWSAQLQSSRSLEVHDPLCGLDIRQICSSREERVFDRWIWPVSSGQVHLMEALAYSS
jgi:hypothetical protein